MKIVYNIYVAVRKLWNAIFGKNGDGSQLVIPGRISGASDDVTVGEGLNLTNNVMKSTVPVVSANPTLEGTESNLTGLQVGDTKYNVPTPTTVVANPTLAGTENDLTGLQVGDTKYKVGGGDKLYTHDILHEGSMFYCRIITKSSTPFTLTTFLSYMNTKHPNINKGIMANGYVSNERAIIQVISGSTAPNKISVMGYKPADNSFYSAEISISTTAFIDTVTEIA